MGVSVSKRKRRKLDKLDLPFSMSDSYLSSKRSSSIYFKRLRRNSTNNDDKVDKLDSILRKLWDGDFKAPVEDVLKAGNARILDIRTGKGTWVMKCAENFPLSNFTGIDNYAIFPKVTNVKLINATFLRSNILNKLFFNDNTFDYVHMRCLTPVFTEKEWMDQVLKELIRVCKPGGWIELVELDNTYLNPGPTLKKVNEAVRECLIVRDVKNPILRSNYLKQADQITDIKEEIKHPPYYGSKIGKGFGECLIEYLQTHRDILAGYMGCSHGEWEETIDTIKKEFVEYKTEGIMKRVYVKKIVSSQDSNSV